MEITMKTTIKNACKVLALTILTTIHCGVLFSMYKTPLITDLKTAQDVWKAIENNNTLAIQLAHQITYHNFKTIPLEVMQALSKSNRNQYDPVNGYPEATWAIVNAVLPTIIKKNENWDVLNTLLSINTTNTYTYIGIIVKQFLDQVSQNNPKEAENLAKKTFIAMVKTTLKHPHHWELIYDLAKINNPLINKEIETYIKKQYPNIDSTLKQCQEYSPLDIALFCGKQANPVFIYTKMKNIPLSNDKKIQSHQQFNINVKKCEPHRLAQSFSQPLRTMFLEALQQEALARENKKLCFWRGETLYKLFQALLAKSLYNRMADKKCPDTFYPLRASVFLPEMNEHEGGICSEDTRKTLLDKNNRRRWDTSGLIYMNYALFANTTEWGSSTPKLLDLNMNWKPEKYSTHDMFRLFGCENIHKKYEKQLIEIEDEAKKSICGFLLMFAFDAEQAQNYIYPAYIAGKHRTININGVQENNIIKIIDALADKPESIGENDTDKIEFCAIFGDIFSPQSKNPVNIKWFIVESMKPWLKKLNALLFEIEHDTPNKTIIPRSKL
jgi:hypothetical protein